MSATPPAKIALDHDDFHAEYVGRTADGRQFFLTTPFHPDIEFLALYLFDQAGKFVDAKIENLGPPSALDEEKLDALRDDWLNGLGKFKFGRIEVQPFSLERFGTTFGFVAAPPKGAEDEWLVEVQPGSYMTFAEPWDSGEYDT
ncbi:MAG: hypothetical protein WC718_07695 [Phycisphaerales bacterium]|jgi:hypothetical protein